MKRVLFIRTQNGLRSPDDYDYMQPEPVALLEKKVGPFLR